MNTKLNIVTVIVALLLLSSCGQSNEKKTKPPAIKKDSIPTTFLQNEKKRLEKRKEIEEQDKIDSLLFDKVLYDALKMVTENSKNKFQNIYKIAPDIEVKINLDNHFTKNYPHLIIHRYGANHVYIDIYSKVNNKFEKVVSHKEWSLTYRNDIIKDINGDGLKDFVVNWYGATGCCLKAFTDIYLLRKDKKAFSNRFEFINPTFSPQEKIIRGIEYGHPGKTEIYKYKWNGEAVDTLEYVYYETDREDRKTGKFIISKNRPYNTNKKETKRVNSMPDEYTKIDDYDWFTGKGF